MHSNGNERSLPRPRSRELYTMGPPLLTHAKQNVYVAVLQVVVAISLGYASLLLDAPPFMWTFEYLARHNLANPNLEWIPVAKWSFFLFSLIYLCTAFGLLVSTLRDYSAAKGLEEAQYAY